jgi:hypothetical protein
MMRPAPSSARVGAMATDDEEDAMPRRADDA